MNGRRQSTVSDFRRRKQAKVGEEFANKLASSAKTAQIHDVNNLAFLRQVESLQNTLAQVFEEETAANLELGQSYLFFNGMRLKANFATMRNLRFLTDEFERWNMGSISIKDGVETEELKAFVFLLAQTDDKGENPFELLTDGLLRRGITHILLGRMREFSFAQKGGAVDLKEAAKKTFLEGIYYLKGIARRVDLGEGIHAKPARRIVRSFVDLVFRDESYLMGLTTIKNYEDYTLNHSVNVCILSLVLGIALGLSRKLLSELGIAALFHDIGKVQIPIEILKKPGGLTREEFEIVKKHPVRGAQLLARMKGMSEIPVRAIQCILEHHMGHDLSGYPRLPREKLQLFSRVVAIADSFDAMTTSRPYRISPMTPQHALATMWRERGEGYDPLLLKVFINTLGVYPVGSLVLLDSDEIALVVGVSEHAEHPHRPRVKVLSDFVGRKADGETRDLAEKSGDGFKWSIVKSLNPQDYGVDIPSHFT